jgi:hypothetical protein
MNPRSVHNEPLNSLRRSLCNAGTVQNHALGYAEAGNRTVAGKRSMPSRHCKSPRLKPPYILLYVLAVPNDERIISRGS